LKAKSAPKQNWAPSAVVFVILSVISYTMKMLSLKTPPGELVPVELVEPVAWSWNWNVDGDFNR
jgi:hypothetical protein